MSCQTENSNKDIDIEYLKNAFIEKYCYWNGIQNRSEQTEERICKPKNRSFASILTEDRKEKINYKEKLISGICGDPSTI